MECGFRSFYRVNIGINAIRQQNNQIKHVRPTKMCRNMSTKKQNASEYCVDLVRKYDHENFLATLLLPKEQRSVAFAIRALNVELALVREMVSQKLIGDMRMQFWRDAIDKIYLNEPPHQPVALELSRVLNGKGLTKQWFRRLIDSRAQRLNDQPFESLDELEKYSENSIAPVYYLLLQNIGVQNVNADHVASHCAKAQGVANVIRGAVFNAKQGRVLLPTDVMIKHSVSQEQLLRGQAPEILREVMFDVASLAHQHLETARRLRKDLPPEALVVFLPLVATDRYLDRLRRMEFDAFHPKLQIRDGALPVRLWWHRFKKLY